MCNECERLKMAIEHHRRSGIPALAGMYEAELTEHQRACHKLECFAECPHLALVMVMDKYERLTGGSN